MSNVIWSWVILWGVSVVAFVAGWTLGDPGPPPDLADRINAACKPGDHVYDWTTGDEFNPVPAGTVKVTCQGKTDSYIVAVQRG